VQPTSPTEATYLKPLRSLEWRDISGSCLNGRLVLGAGFLTLVGIAREVIQFLVKYCLPPGAVSTIHPLRKDLSARMSEGLNATLRGAQMSRLRRDFPLDLSPDRECAPTGMSRAVEFDGRPIWAEVSLAAILHNLRVIRQHIGGKRKVLAIVKANAYGLGAVPISRALTKAGTEWFGVTCTTEGAELREAGIRRRILVLSGFWQGEETQLLRYGLTPTVTRVEQLRPLERAAASPSLRGKRPRVPFHLKINTGMNRLGIDSNEIGGFVKALADSPHLELEATYTHFASSDDFTSEQTSCQEKRFAEALARLCNADVSPGMVHLANSAAICTRPGTWGDLVRPGAILYGYHQSLTHAEHKYDVMGQMPLRPCLTLRTRIISLRDGPPGQGVGYGAQFVTQRRSRIAVLAAGYADGLVRELSNRGCVLVRGKPAPIVGMISMDLAAIDATDVPDAAVGDIATIYGSDGNSSISVSDAAHEVGTVTSDLLCAIGRRVPRFYLS
jgi:alanine racemase